jgi:hypothetical protein
MRQVSSTAAVDMYHGTTGTFRAEDHQTNHVTCSSAVTCQPATQHC